MTRSAGSILVVGLSGLSTARLNGHAAKQRLDRLGKGLAGTKYQDMEALTELRLNDKSRWVPDLPCCSGRLQLVPPTVQSAGPDGFRG